MPIKPLPNYEVVPLRSDNTVVAVAQTTYRSINASNARVGYLLDHTYKTSKRLNMPMLVGEWGAFHSMDSIFVDQTNFILEKFENYKCGQTYWAHYQGKRAGYLHQGFPKEFFRN